MEQLIGLVNTNLDDSLSGVAGSYIGYGMGWTVYETLKNRVAGPLTPPMIESAISSLFLEAVAVAVFVGSFFLLGAAIGTLLEHHEMAGFGVSGLTSTVLRAAAPVGLFDVSLRIHSYEIANLADVLGTFYVLLFFLGLIIVVISAYVLKENW